MIRAYLDSSFLVALLLDNHACHDAVETKILSISEDNNYLILISTLTIDEVWYTLYELTSEKGQLFSDFTRDFAKTINDFLDTYCIKIVDVLEGADILSKALEGSEKYNLRPRDAFHYANASIWKATVYTLDADYVNTDLSVEYTKA